MSATAIEDINISILTNITFLSIFKMLRSDRPNLLKEGLRVIKPN